MLRDGRDGDVYAIDDYLCDLVEGTLRAGDDADEAGWFDRAALDTVPMVDGSRLLARVGRTRAARLSAGRRRWTQPRGAGSGRPGCSPPRASMYSRVGTMTLRRKMHTTVPSCL